MVPALMDSSEMGRKRWEGVSDEQRKAEMAKVRANVRLTKTERAGRARVASLARWAKARAAKQTGKPMARTKKRKAPKGGSETRKLEPQTDSSPTGILP
jgi:hypothetical protein